MNGIAGEQQVLLETSFGTNLKLLVHFIKNPKLPKLCFLHTLSQYFEDISKLVMPIMCQSFW